MKGMIVCLLLIAGCGDEIVIPICAPGLTQECACPGGSVKGAQTCEEDGEGWGECQCEVKSDAGRRTDALIGCVADCHDSLSCTLDNCENNTCVHALQSDYCIISNTCVASGTFDPSNGCRKCDPKKNATGWTDADGKACDDKNKCTITDTCKAGVCKGTVYCV